MSRQWVCSRRVLSGCKSQTFLSKLFAITVTWNSDGEMCNFIQRKFVFSSGKIATYPRFGFSLVLLTQRNCCGLSNLGKFHIWKNEIMFLFEPVNCLKENQDKIQKYWKKLWSTSSSNFLSVLTSFHMNKLIKVTRPALEKINKKMHFDDQLMTSHGNTLLIPFVFKKTNLKWSHAWTLLHFPTDCFTPSLYNWKCWMFLKLCRHKNVLNCLPLR